MTFPLPVHSASRPAQRCGGIRTPASPSKGRLHLSITKKSRTHSSAARSSPLVSPTFACAHFLGSPRWLLSLALRCVVPFTLLIVVGSLSARLRLSFRLALPSISTQNSRPVRHRGVISATFHPSLTWTLFPQIIRPIYAYCSRPQATASENAAPLTSPSAASSLPPVFPAALIAAESQSRAALQHPATTTLRCRFRA
jgi:hypothetical protein